MKIYLFNYYQIHTATYPVFQGPRQNRISAAEARIFWLALILCPMAWAVFFVIALFGLKFKWLLLVCIAIILNGANLYGYVKCKMGNDRNISAATGDFFRKQVIQNVSTMVVEERIVVAFTLKVTLLLPIRPRNCVKSLNSSE